jgi:hypothetical protein
MAQISKGDTFVDGQQVTGARLNQLVDASTLLVGAITDQPSITANTLEATDSTIVNDAGTLKEATIGDILNSNLPVSTSSITGGTGVDLVVTPAAGQKVDVAGNLEADDFNATGNATVAGNQTVTGDLAVTGTSTLTGDVTADNAFTSNGVANFTGTLQINGSVGYGLIEITEETPTQFTNTSSGAWNLAWTSTAYTKPSDEIWVVELCTTSSTYPSASYSEIKLERSVTSSVVGYDMVWSNHSGGSLSHYQNIVFRYIINAGSAVTAETAKIFVKSLNNHASTVANSTSYPSVLRIYKYKTA